MTRSRLHEIERFADCPLLAISANQLLAYRQELDERGLSPNSQHTIYYMVRKFFQWAVTTGLLAADPTKQLPPPAARDPNQPPPSPIKTVTEEEFADILAYLDERADLARANAAPNQVNLPWVVSDMPTKRNRLILRLMYECGVALAETLRIRREDVVSNTIVIKRRYAAHVVTLPPQLAADMRAFMEEYTASDYVFYGDVNGHGPVSPQQALTVPNLHHLLRDIAEEFGWDRRTFVAESFRRSFAQRVFAETKNTDSVRARLGLNTVTAALRYLV